MSVGTKTPLEWGHLSEEIVSANIAYNERRITARRIALQRAADSVRESRLDLARLVRRAIDVGMPISRLSAATGLSRTSVYKLLGEYGEIAPVGLAYARPGSNPDSVGNGAGVDNGGTAADWTIVGPGKNFEGFIVAGPGNVLHEFDISAGKLRAMTAKTPENPRRVQVDVPQEARWIEDRIRSEFS